MRRRPSRPPPWSGIWQRALPAASSTCTCSSPTRPTRWRSSRSTTSCPTGWRCRGSSRWRRAAGTRCGPTTPTRGSTPRPVSVRVRSKNQVPIVVERSMWWPDGRWIEAHVSAGATAGGTRWLVAGGEESGAAATNTYTLIANISDWPATVDVSVFFENGGESSRTFTVPALSRFTVDATAFPESRDRRFAVLVESRGAQPAELVVGAIGLQRARVGGRHVCPRGQPLVAAAPDQGSRAVPQLRRHPARDVPAAARGPDADVLGQRHVRRRERADRRRDRTPPAHRRLRRRRVEGYGGGTRPRRGGRRPHVRRDGQPGPARPVRTCDWDEGAAVPRRGGCQRRRLSRAGRHRQRRRRPSHPPQPPRDRARPDRRSLRDLRPPRESSRRRQRRRPRGSPDVDVPCRSRIPPASPGCCSASQTAPTSRIRASRRSASGAMATAS